jgi:DNA primase
LFERTGGIKMGKISPVSAKYIIQASIEIDGVVDKPDVIGAIFGQTEGLLGADLELRELQRSGRIGRIEVNVDTKSGKSQGEILIPSSLDKAETAIVGAALEIIQRIGPCNAKIKVQKIEDVRISKREFIVERAKELLKNLMESSMPDSQELADEVAYSVRVMEIQEYGKARLPCGPGIEESDEIMVVEGRADVLNLLKHGFKNSIAINGTSVPEEIIELGKRKVLTVFVDGDRGGDLIIKELLTVAEIDFITKAPDGKELEELTKKEIHKAIRSKITTEQYRLEHNGMKPEESIRRPMQERRGPPMREQREQREQPREQRPMQQRTAPPVRFKKNVLSDEEKIEFSRMLEDLIGTRGAYILDEKLNILGKVPVTELPSTIKSLTTGIYAVVFDGIIDKALVSVAERSTIKYIVAMDSKVDSSETRINMITSKDLE